MADEVTMSAEYNKQYFSAGLGGGGMAGMSSTLVETVSINYEDFNESFLTCGTCLCMYDGGEHTPKLLPCSHSVCLHCLGRIAAAHTRDTGCFRCPICRELITIPRGGVAALPPSFLVNQLLDLMARQRREVVPKCSTHTTQELLFCETCDCVFCALCTGGPHSEFPCDHTIIPFSIAIKRMSEILLYKANECLSKLTSAREGVVEELRRLESAREAGAEAAAVAVRELTAAVEKRHRELLQALSTAAHHKKDMLEDQLRLIDKERHKVEQECCGLQNQIEAKDISVRIATLGDMLSGAACLSEPRENSFLALETQHNDALERIYAALPLVGRIRTTTTYPPLCTAALEGSAVAGLECTVLMKTVDYHGDPRVSGGDPVTVTAKYENTTPLETVDCHIHDLDDGTYRIAFRPPHSGNIVLSISVVGRPIRGGGSVGASVSGGVEAGARWGGRGHTAGCCIQPAALAFHKELGVVYLLDAGNSRIHVLDTNLNSSGYIENEGLQGRSCTGMGITERGLVVVNWRSRRVTEMSVEGDTLGSWGHEAFQEPVAIAVDPVYGHLLVADNGARAVFVFDANGKYLFQIGGNESELGLIGGVAVASSGEILVVDSAVHLYSAKGDLLTTYAAIPKSKGSYGGVDVDAQGRVVCLRWEKNKTKLCVMRLKDGEMLTSCQLSARLRRPGALAVMGDEQLVITDLAGDCVKKYKYW